MMDREEIREHLKQQMRAERARIARGDDVDRERSLAENFNKIAAESEMFDASVGEEGMGQSMDEIAGGPDAISTEELERRLAASMDSSPTAWQRVVAWAWAVLTWMGITSTEDASDSARSTAPDTTARPGDPLGVFDESTTQRMRNLAQTDRSFDMSSAWCGTDRMIDDRRDRTDDER